MGRRSTDPLSLVAAVFSAASSVIAAFRFTWCVPGWLGADRSAECSLTNWRPPGSLPLVRRCGFFRRGVAPRVDPPKELRRPAPRTVRSRRHRPRTQFRSRAATGGRAPSERRPKARTASGRWRPLASIDVEGLRRRSSATLGLEERGEVADALGRIEAGATGAPGWGDLPPGVVGSSERVAAGRNGNAVPTACASSGPACVGASASCATSSACGRASSKPARTVSFKPRPNGRG